MLSFIRNLVGVKTDQVVQSGIEALVKWDPQAATEAELRTMEENLDKLGLQVAEARTAYEREQKEAVAIQQLSDQRMAAAEQLEAQLANQTDPGRRAALEKSLGTLVNMLEEMAPEVEREQREAAEAKEFLDMLEQSYNQAAQKLKGAKSELQRAQRDMAKAEQQRKVAEQQAEAARVAAGLAGQTSGLTVALKAMQESAAKDKANAEVAMNKAKLLRPTKPEEEDPNIAAALAAASGKAPPATSISGRLAALKNKGATTA